jgi:phospholipid transport system substrate-binding protein
MLRRIGASLAILSFMFLLTPCVAVAASSEEAAKFVDGLGRRAFQMLNQQGTTLDQKEAQVRALLAENFDLKLIGRYVVGQSWRTMGEERQEAYLALFEEYVLRTYSKRLGGYSGQQFQIAGVKSASPEDHIVATTITRPGAPPIEANWRVQTKTPQYKIVDVMVAGVSMVVTQRSEFGAVIQRRGVDGLIETLRMQVSKIPAQAK